MSDRVFFLDHGESRPPYDTNATLLPGLFWVASSLPGGLGWTRLDGFPEAGRTGWVSQLASRQNMIPVA